MICVSSPSWAQHVLVPSRPGVPGSAAPWCMQVLWASGTWGRGRSVIICLLHKIQPTLVPQPKQKWNNKKKMTSKSSLIKAFERTQHADIDLQIYYYNRTWAILMKSQSMGNTVYCLWKCNFVCKENTMGSECMQDYDTLGFATVPCHHQAQSNSSNSSLGGRTLLPGFEGRWTLKQPLLSSLVSEGT